MEVLSTACTVSTKKAQLKPTKQEFGPVGSKAMTMELIQI